MAAFQPPCWAAARQPQPTQHRLAGNTSGNLAVAHDEESVMTRLYIGRLGWLAGIVLLTAILLLATRIEVPTWTVRESA
jgi:hypothetical protein